MELKGEYRIPAPRAQVWAALNDAEVLRACIPGCESLEGSPTEGFSARVTTKIGPVKATFNGAVTLSNVNAPESYTISGEGKGGVAGFAKGGADVRLAEDGADTVLTYSVNAQVGGKLAQLGSRLIDSTAKKLADQFFTCFAARAGAPASGLVSGDPSPLAAASPVLVDPPLAPSLAAEAVAAASAAPAAPGMAGFTPKPLRPDLGGSGVAPAVMTGQASSGASVESLAHDVEAEVEREAAVGFLGGPIVWGLLVILALLFVFVVAT